MTAAPRIRARFDPSARSFRIAVWLFSVVLAAGAGWLVGRTGARSSATLARPDPAQGAREPTVWPGFGPLIDEASATDEPEPAILAERETPPEAPAPAAAKQPPPAAAVVAPRQTGRPDQPDPEPVADEPPVVALDPIETAPASAGVLVRALEASRAAEQDDASARDEAQRLLQDFPSYSALTAALLEDGAGEAQAPLTAMRMLQLAGLEDISRDVARELLRSFGATERVAESIRRWKVLDPYIEDVDSSIGDGRWVTVTGTVSNPDVVALRRLWIRIEALDAARNVLDSVEVRVRPRVLDPGGQGTFVAEFKNVDPSSVLRTRALIVRWDSEVPPD